MPIKGPQKQWREETLPYRVFGRLLLPKQAASNLAKEKYFKDLSYEPAHALTVYKPLGGINRARIAIYTELANIRLNKKARVQEHP